MKLTLFSVILGSLAAVSVNAQSLVPLWGQCGGDNWNGSTQCEPCLICYSYNPFYSRCIPGPDYGNCL
ncbi:hypothetical protein FRC03_009499 [Tulasnella sp. 419]|nr:hypothetical protein FRC02_010300 [Tulasnella sp. 418]KAG8958052.1 hypothetical protein FRC03_009499 [Tulasnella sp. 419]